MRGINVAEHDIDWDAVEKPPPKLKAAVKLFIKTGDLRLSQRLSGLDLEDLVELLRRLKVPVFIG